MALVFAVPENGDEIVSPDRDWLRQLVLHGGSDFWCGGNGQGCLKHPSGAELLLAFAADYGFFPEYVGQQRDKWIAFSAPPNKRKVPIWIGGDPIIVSEQFFVLPDTAWTIVEEFCSSGERAKQIDWKPRSQVNWSFAYWDHPDFNVSANRILDR